MSKREQILQAARDLVVAAIPYASVERNAAKPARVEPGGRAILFDGDPGEPEVDLCPLTYNYEHRIPLEVYAFSADPLVRASILDQLLGAIGAAVVADRTLSGLVDFLEVEAPASDDVETAGANPIRAADLALVAHYATSDPLN